MKAINGESEAHSWLTPFRLFLIGFSIAAALLFVPVYFADPKYFADDMWLVRLIKTVFLSAHNTVRLFILDGDFEIIHEAAAALEGLLYNIYTAYTAVVYIIAPILTARFVLSFFENASAWLQFIFRQKADIYVMSELNECSIALAQDIVRESNEKKKKSLILFADVFEDRYEDKMEMVTHAKRIGALCFSKDVSELSLKPHNQKISRKIYLISENDNKNLRQALDLIATYGKNDSYNNENTHFYVFTSTPESEALLDSCDYKQMKVRRIKRKRSLTYSLLQKYHIFDDAKPYGNVINIVLVGLGGYGSELLKTLCWYGQMPEYTLNIHAFDSNPNAEDRLWAECPDLMKYNHVKMAGEPFYHLYFHCGVDVDSYAFYTHLSEIRNVTTAFVMLGDDSLNISTAMKLRMIFERNTTDHTKKEPSILAVVYSTEKNQFFQGKDGLHGVDEIDYKIEFVGSMESRYTLKEIGQESIEALGKKWNEFWAKQNSSTPKTEEEKKTNEEKFDKYEYYRNSSIASAIYWEERKRLKLLEEENKELNKTVDHLRWNAYMRALGYISGDKKCHLAKKHSALVPLGLLSQEEILKDGIHEHVLAYNSKDNKETPDE